MNQLVSLIHLSPSYQIGLLVFYAISIVAFGWAAINLAIMLIKNVIFHIRTKKENERVFKQFNFHPKR